MSKEIKYNLKLIEALVILVIFVAEISLFFCTPLLSQIRHEFGVDEAYVQYIMSFNILGMAISSFIYGSLSDVTGRRAMMLAGVFIVCLATGMCILSPNIELLILSRLLQGLGLGVAWTIGNAVLRDCMDDKQFSKSIVFVHMVAGIIPVIAPIIGGYIGEYFGWRTNFAVVMIVAIVALIICFFKLPETCVTKEKFAIKTITNNYLHLLTNKTFLYYLTVKVAMVAAAFMDFSNLPLIMIESYGCSMVYFGFLVVFAEMFYVSTCAINNKLTEKFGIAKILVLGIFLLSISFSSLLALQQLELSPLLVQIIRLPIYIGMGFIFGNATYYVISVFPKKAGSAAAIMISLEMTFSSLTIKIVGNFYDGTFTPIAICALGYVAIAAFALKKARQQN